MEDFMKIQIPVKKLREDAKLPFSGSAQAAGYDLYACTGNGTTVIQPHSNVMIGTGIACAIPEGYFGGIFARSGLAAKEGLRPANCVGVVDSDYRGEIRVVLHNDTDTERSISDGERIAQLVVMPYLAVSFAQTEDLEETERGEGGFGHTGKA